MSFIFRLICDHGVCSSVRKFLWYSIFRLVFQDFRRSSVYFLPKSIPPDTRVVHTYPNVVELYQRHTKKTYTRH